MPSPFVTFKKNVYIIFVFKNKFYKTKDVCFIFNWSSPLNSDLICSQDSIGVVPPPNTQTVKNTISRVVVNIICRAYVAVSRIARANAIAPRSPAEHKHTHTAVKIDFSKNDSPAPNRMEVQPSHSIGCVLRSLHFAALLAGWCCWSGGSCST